MPKISKLETRVLSAFGSINLNDEDKNRINIDFVSKFFESYSPCVDYFLITHNDTDTLHIHYLIKLNRQVRLSTIINFIAEGLEINPLAINIDKCRGFNLCLRYMLHIDESSKVENKVTFDIKDIVSNRDINYINLLIQSDDECECSWETLIRAVIRYSKTSDLIKYLGLKTYHKYRFEIRDLIDEKLNYPSFNMDYSYLNDDLPF